jgi:hypothetical protein
LGTQPRVDQTPLESVMSQVGHQKEEVI